MRFDTGNMVVELGGAGGDVIAASNTLTFDWIPGRSEWSYWGVDFDEQWSGSGPSPYRGYASFDVSAPSLAFSETPSAFHFELSQWEVLDGGVGSTELYPWTWLPQENSLHPSVWTEAGHNSWRIFGPDVVEAHGSAVEGGFHILHYGHWEMRRTPDLAAMGGDGDDILYGGSGEDILNGGAGDDILVSGLKATIMTGGDGADIFVFGAGSGMDIVRDFEIDRDRLSFDTQDGQRLVSDAQELAGSALLDLGGGHTVLLAGVSPGLLLSAGPAGAWSAEDLTWL